MKSKIKVQTITIALLAVFFIPALTVAGDLEDLTRAIEQNPQDVSAYIKRGNVYRKMKQYDNAIADYTKALSLDSHSTYAYDFRGACYNFKGEYDKALDDLNKAISLSPNFADAYYNRHYAYYKKKMYERAIEDLTKVISLRPDKNNFPIYALRGKVYEEMGLHDMAAKDYKIACEGMTIMCK